MHALPEPRGPVWGRTGWEICGHIWTVLRPGEMPVPVALAVNHLMLGDLVSIVRFSEGKWAWPVVRNAPTVPPFDSRIAHSAHKSWKSLFLFSILSHRKRAYAAVATHWVHWDGGDPVSFASVSEVQLSLGGAHISLKGHKTHTQEARCISLSSAPQILPWPKSLVCPNSASLLSGRRRVTSQTHETLTSSLYNADDSTWHKAVIQ